MSRDSEHLRSLWLESRSLLGAGAGDSPSIPHLSTPSSPLRFLRDFVSASRPVLIPSGAAHFPAVSLWKNDSYLLSSLRSTPVSLHLTPHGNADSLVPHPDGNGIVFASSFVREVPFPEALGLVRSSGNDDSPFVAYLQEQNDCFRTEYSALAGDVDEDIGWATEALGCRPEAVNLWIGNERSVTSFHKDHYENLYVVVCGEKEFLLLPPTEVARMYVRKYPAARYSEFDMETGEFKLELERRDVPWASVDPYPYPSCMETAAASFPLYFDDPKPFHCTVKAGDILYLPSMWYHHVRQTPDSSGRVIAVNYWYDMQFDMKYAYFNFVQSICATCEDDDDEPSSPL